jgi:streptomycin 6-kinase
MTSPLPISPDRRHFEGYVVELRTRGAAFDEVVDTLVAIMLSGLSLREKDRRATLLLGIAALDTAEVERAARVIDEKGAPMPQVLARGAQYRQPEPSSAKLAPPRQGTATAATGGATASEDADGMTVLLLGSATDHHANISLLDNKHIGVTRIDNPARFSEVGRDPFCGVVVAASWWSAIPPTSHERELARILGSSTIPWVRIDVSTLDSPVATALSEIVRRTYGADRTHAMLCHGRGCDITSSDLASIRAVNEVLSSAGKVGFHPAEISVHEAQLVRAAILGHVRSRRGTMPAVEAMAIRFIHGGLSGARVAIATPDDRGMPLVVKLGELSMMRQEAHRYSFVALWEGGGAVPDLHFHGDCALLLVPLVDDGDGGAARTLADVVKELVYSDLHPATDTGLLDKTRSCVSRALRRIAKLNTTTFEAGSPRNLADLFARSLAGRQIAAGGGDVGTALEKARARVAKLDGCATVHGDLHLGNVLVRGDAPAFIDFGQAGAGHPAQDIAKLDSQIWFQAFRLTDDVAQLAALLRASFRGTPVDELVSEFPVSPRRPPSIAARRAVVLARARAATPASVRSSSSAVSRQPSAVGGTAAASAISWGSNGRSPRSAARMADSRYIAGSRPASFADSTSHPGKLTPGSPPVAPWVPTPSAR